MAPQVQPKWIIMITTPPAAAVAVTARKNETKRNNIERYKQFDIFVEKNVNMNDVVCS